MATCVICLKLFTDDEKPTNLTQKGCNGIIKASTDHGRNIFPVPGDKVHERCRKKHTNGVPVYDLSSIASEAAVQNDFSFEKNCLFCGENVKCKTGAVYHVKSTSFRETISHIISERNDEWAKEVSSRIELEANLHEVNASYHQQCNVNFRTYRNKPNAGISAQKGAPINAHLNDSFLQLVAFLESSNEPYSTIDLIKMLQEYSGGEAYCVRYLKEKLMKHFGDRIMFIGRDGLSDIVIMREASERMIIKSYEEKSSQIDRMETAAKYVLSDIKSMSNNKNVYPSPEEVASMECGLAFIPQSLRTFLSVLFGQQKTDQTAKVISIGHAIIQVCCPRRLLSPIQLGLGIQISVLTTSRFLIDTLHGLGFCCSYAEVRKFKYCATIFNDQIETEQLAPQNKVTKYVADNVDHNLCTLDGKGTFHGMGMISIEAATEKGHEKRIPRIKATIDDVKKVKGVEIIHYADDVEDIVCIKYSKLSPTVISDVFQKLDLLWTLSWPSVPDRPAWSGFMQMVATGSYLPKPTITFLPMIDMSSTSSTCIYSTMLFIAREARTKGTTPVLTFDQLLHWKARLIIEMEPTSSPLKKIVLMLGGFHMKMSFLGCIGYLMSGSGLQEVLEQTYAPNTVVKMLTGKAIARSIRGHLLVFAALSAIINEKTFSENEKSKLASLYHATVTKELNVNQLENDPDLMAMDMKLTESKKKLQLVGPTSRLWIQYINMMEILKSNIRSDRTSDLQLHLQTVQAMLPYFPASGHNNYTKSIYVYIQDIQRLKETNPEVYAFLNDGNFVTRRSDRYWSGLPDDLVIEQVLMRSLKSTGGLTRGTGFGEVQRTIWLKSMPTCASMNDAMQHFTHKALETSEQHKEIGLTRQKRDIQDTKVIYDYLNERNIFEKIPGLRNIVDGVVSNANCNAYLAESVGNKIIKKLEENGSSNYVFKQKDRVVVMNSKNTIQIDDDNVQIDPEVLFQRLLFIQNNRDKDDVASILQYELTQRPPVFFDENGFLRDGNESAISDTLWKKFSSKMSIEYEILDECVYVLSGEWVLNEVCWQKGETFDEICKRYVEFILRKYGKSTTIIFKECEMIPTILDEKFLRNRKGICGAEVFFADDTPLKAKKQEFLNNDKNRNGFVKMLEEKLVKAGCSAYSTIGDVYVLIAQTAATMSRKKMVVVIGEEANLLPLMCFYVEANNCGLYLRCSKKQKSTQSTRLWNITETQNLMGIDKSKYLLFVHAYGGCQSTSHIFGIGEGILYNKLDDKHFVAQAKIFCNRFATRKEVIDAGEKAMVLLFKGKASQKLNTLRFEKYKEKIATETFIVVAKRLPPTEAATACHSLRAFYQIQVWMQQSKELNPLDYGWKQGTNSLRPVLTNLPPAPASLLSSIRCGCKGYCDTRRCNCKGIGLRCTTACKHCDHESCKNYEILCEGEDDDDDIENLFLDF